MFQTFKLAVAIPLVALASGLTAAPQKRATARRPSPARAATAAPRPFDPKAYAASVDGVDCTNVAARARSVVPIEKALHGIASAYPWGPPTKGEFESSSAFDQRVHDELSAKLGGTDRIVAVIPIRDMVKYNADTSTLTIDPVDKRIKENVITVKAYSDIDGESTYVGSNAYGASTEVSRHTFTQFYMLLPARGQTAITSTMAPDAARSLKENGSLVLVGSLLSPYIAYERQRGRRTISDPNDVTYLQFYLGMIAQCAVIVNQGQEVGRIAL